MSRLPNATTVLNGTVANVYEDQLGAVLTVTANIGDGTITVDDTAEFDGDQGGSVQVAGNVYDYTAVDDETGVVTLATTLTTGASEGDGVQLWDTSTNSPAVELRALVNLPGQDANGEAIDAAIRHNLQPLLAEGIREPLKGESVEMNLIGDDWMVVDVFGKRARFVPGFAGAAWLAYAVFYDSGGTTGITSYRLNGTSVSDSDGDYATYMQYDGFPGVQLLVSGKYAVTATALVNSLPDGDPAYIVIDSPYGPGAGAPTSDGGVGYGVSVGGIAWCEAHATFLLTAPYTPGVVTATVIIPGATAGDIGGFNWIKVYKLPD